MRLTVAQALVRFLANQWTERDGVRHRLVAGCFGIFGHGNVAGIGEALRAAEVAGEPDLIYRQARNEQAMVHAAVGYARMSNRLSAYACTTSIGPGATNLVTGAALATINRLPVLLLPGDTFSTRVAEPVLQQLEHPGAGDISVNDTLRPVSRYFDRVARAEQLVPAALAAMRVLADPAETGAVTLALPQDVQAEAYDFDPAFFAPRVWRVRRPVPDAADLADAVALLRAAERPLLVAGGGVIYSEATGALAGFAEATGIPVAETQAGKGALRYDHPAALGAIGATGSTAANAIAAGADVVLGVGTRWSDFTTASHTAFGAAGARFVNLNVTAFDAAKQSGVSLVGDARAGLAALTDGLTGYRTAPAYQERVRALAAGWDGVVQRTYHPDSPPDTLTQGQVLGAVNDGTEPRDVVVCAAGSMPGELHKLWRTRDPKGYHVEYGYSCMGYEIAGGFGVKLAAPDREVIVLVGDGSYLMMAQELVTAVAEGVKIVVVLVDNGGYASIGALSETVGAQRFGTAYRYRAGSGRLDGGPLPVDLAANAASLGADVLRVSTVDELRAGLREARGSTRTTVLHVRTDPLTGGPDSAAWWDVPVAEVSELDTAKAARSTYQHAKRAQRHYL
jgi:3D-(3,5/4)-trihydroxycyclohexane-1,2-dione acylhydrolase (decyclizing)